MTRRDTAVSRRAFLRGAGAAIALPYLESLPRARGAARAAAATPPVRLGVLFFPNGVWEKGWVPAAKGAGYDSPFALTPLGPHKSEVLVLSGLDKAESRSGDGHYAKTANFLTGLKITKTTGKDINAGGVSLDQYAAAKLAGKTPLPSLELGIDPVISGIDSNVGYTRLYGSYISWRSATNPVAREINPRLVYERLFGAKDGTGPGGDDRLLLDRALDDARRLRGKLGRDDQFKLDEYLDSVRAVESRLDFAASPPAGRWTPTSPRPDAAVPGAAAPADFQQHVKLMLDLTALAFWSDSTRVVTFMFANDVSGRNFSFVDGVKGGHHDISHHSNDAAKIEQYQRINRWHVAQFAYLLGKLRSVKEGEGTLLDNSLVMLGSSLSDGNRHDPNNLPVLLGGRGGRTVTPGRHLSYPKNTPLCNLYVSLLERVGAPVKAFGDSTGPLADLS